jgi:hypothetical protein
MLWESFIITRHVCHISLKTDLWSLKVVKIIFAQLFHNITVSKESFHTYFHFYCSSEQHRKAWSWRICMVLPAHLHGGTEETTDISVWISLGWDSNPCPLKYEEGMLVIQTKTKVTMTSVISPTAEGWHQPFVWGPSSSCPELCGGLPVGLPASAVVPALQNDCIFGRVRWHVVPERALCWTVDGGWMTQNRCPIPADSDPLHQFHRAELYTCSQNRWLLPKITGNSMLSMLRTKYL